MQSEVGITQRRMFCRNGTSYSYGAALHDHHVQYSSQVRVIDMTAIGTAGGILDLV